MLKDPYLTFELYYPFNFVFITKNIDFFLTLVEIHILSILKKLITYILKASNKVIFRLFEVACAGKWTRNHLDLDTDPKPKPGS